MSTSTRVDLESNLPSVSDQRLAEAMNARARATVEMLNALCGAAEARLGMSERACAEAEARAALLERALGARETDARTDVDGSEDVEAVRGGGGGEDGVVDVARAGASSDGEDSDPAGDAAAGRAATEPARATEDEGETTREGEADAMLNDPKYGMYFKMIKMGVPEQAVRNKMALDGVDASVLDRR